MLSVAGMILGTAGYMAPIPAPSKFSGAGRLTDHVSPRWLTGSFGITRDELGAQPRSLPAAQQFRRFLTAHTDIFTTVHVS